MMRKQIVAASSSLFAIAQTLAAFTPASGTVKNWELRTIEA